MTFDRDSNGNNEPTGGDDMLSFGRLGLASSFTPPAMPKEHIVHCGSTRASKAFRENPPPPDLEVKDPYGEELLGLECALLPYLEHYLAPIEVTGTPDALLPPDFCPP